MAGVLANLYRVWLEFLQICTTNARVQLEFLHIYRTRDLGLPVSEENGLMIEELKLEL